VVLAYQTTHHHIPRDSTLHSRCHENLRSNMHIFLQVWVFQRINIVSHLPGLCLQAASVNRNQVPHPSWENCDHNNVAVHCMWDNRRLHEEVKMLCNMFFELYMRQQFVWCHICKSLLHQEHSNMRSQVLTLVNMKMWSSGTWHHVAWYCFSETFC
jgi:hypothetical protein